MWGFITIIILLYKSDTGEAELLTVVSCQDESVVELGQGVTDLKCIRSHHLAAQISLAQVLNDTIEVNLPLALQLILAYHTTALAWIIQKVKPPAHMYGTWNMHFVCATLLKIPLKEQTNNIYGDILCTLTSSAEQVKQNVRKERRTIEKIHVVR